MTAVAHPDLGARVWRTAARGAVLVGAAVVLGIILVQVVNGSGVSQAATTKANQLRGLGYAIVQTTNAAGLQTGTTIACRTGFTVEADALAKIVAIGTTVGLFPNPAPANANNADCIVTLGK